MSPADQAAIERAARAAPRLTGDQIYHLRALLDAQALARAIQLAEAEPVGELHSSEL
jgi:hypothetical protein